MITAANAILLSFPRRLTMDAITALADSHPGNLFEKSKIAIFLAHQALHGQSFVEEMLNGPAWEDSKVIQELVNSVVCNLQSHPSGDALSTVGSGDLAARMRYLNASRRHLEVMERACATADEAITVLASVEGVLKRLKMQSQNSLS